MPLYAYSCPKDGPFEQIRSIDTRYDSSCPSCGCKAPILPSCAVVRMHNPFTKDGEGFSSVTYRPEEAKYRAKHNMLKYDKV